MRGCGLGLGLLVASGISITGGCVSMTEHRAMKAANQVLLAEKQALTQDLFDSSSANENLRTRLDAVDREVRISRDLVSNLTRENELLDDMRLTSKAEVEALARNQNLKDITIAGQKLPEQLHNALRQFANEHPTSVVYDAGRGTMKWKSDLLFALGSDTVKETSQDSLRRFTEILKSQAAGGFEAIVVGHTDNRPIAKATTRAKHPTNWHLSVHRAISVATILKRNGLSPERIGVMGFGEFRPIADNSTANGGSQNRRVEIYVLPSGTIAQVAMTNPRGSDG